VYWKLKLFSTIDCGETQITTPLLTKQSRRWTELEECIQAKQKELVLEIIKCVGTFSSA
jgi:hypothetical protein